MPTVMTNMEQDLSDKLEELKVAANGNLDYSIINLHVSEVLAMQDSPEEESDPENKEDAIEKLEAGADLVQVYTGFIYEGPGLMKRINKKILEHYG